MDYKTQIRDYIHSSKEDYLTFFQKTIQEASTVGKEQGVQELIAGRLQEAGLDVDMWDLSYEELSKSSFFNSTRTSFEGSPNVAAVWKGTGDGPSLILNGHVDVVPEGDLSDWNADPFSGKIEDGKVYGRGTTDMKGGNLSSLIALETLMKLGIRLKGDVIFQSVVEEESGGSGTLSCIQRGYKADVALIPEPSQMRIFPKQQGSCWFRVKVQGVSAHGGTRYEGVSAIEKGWHVFREIQSLEKRRNDRITDPLYDSNPIPIPINIGKFEGGYFPSAVPDKVVIEGRMGIAPGETIEEAQQEFENVMKDLAKEDSYFNDKPVEVEWFGLRLPPGNCPLDHDLIKHLSTHYEAMKGEKPDVAGSTWGTDGGLFTQAADIPAVIFGPGTTAMAHFANEYVEIDSMFETAEIMALAIIDYCGLAE
ncbi:peptidase [Alteribacillus iranensis]|uniref:4-acetamidobutyryl-CoA deacetylase n=1 Tax=Alteribacillus iranensis TaxID=930128 RepID=A0A1I2BN89_9BACI|nr:peptidase [Alteribacillus iranensis]SFE56773.1 4-acetamidobutyryl-CoA deacetylase [Alteribacillus iranensis]